jgi:hypothetical protein
MAEQDVNININVNTAGLEQGSKKADAALKRIGKGAKVAGATVDKSLAKATKSVDNLAAVSSVLKDKSGETASVLGKLSSALGLVSPEAAEATMALQQMADGVEGAAQAVQAMKLGAGQLVAGLGLLALAAAALAPVYFEWKAATEQSTRINEEAAIIGEQLIGIYARLESAILGLDEATGDLTKLELDELKIRKAAFTAFQKDTEQLQASLTANRKELGKLEGFKSRLNESRRKELAEEIPLQEAQFAAALESQKQTVNALLVTAELTRSAKVEDDKRTEAAVTNSAVRVGVLDEELALMEEIDAAVAEMARLQRRAFQIEIDERDALNAEIEDAILRQDQMNAQSFAKDQRIFDAEVQQQKDLMALRQTSAAAAISIGDAVLEARLEQIDTETELGQEQALRIFKIQKALAIVQIVIDTIQGAQRAVASSPPPSPLGVAGAVVVGALGTAAVGAVAAQKPPSFAAGGIISQSLAPDHGLIAASAGEAVLNRSATAALGADGVDSLNAGTGSGGPTVVVVPMLGHKIYNDFVAENIAAGGPLQQALERNNRPGHSRFRR